MEEEKKKNMKKLSDNEKEEEEKIRSILEKYEKEILIKLEKNIHDKKMTEKNKVERKFKNQK